MWLLQNLQERLPLLSLNPDQVNLNSFTEGKLILSILLVSDTWTSLVFLTSLVWTAGNLSPLLSRCQSLCLKNICLFSFLFKSGRVYSLGSSSVARNREEQKSKLGKTLGLAAVDNFSGVAEAGAAAAPACGNACR